MSRIDYLNRFVLRFHQKTIYLASGLFLLNFIVKAWYLGTMDIAMDEPFTIFHAQGSLTDIFAMLSTENNPPLFFLLLHYWIKFMGISPVSVRFLPLVFSSLTAVAIFLTGKRFLSFRTGIIAALLFTFSNYNMAFAHEARVYSLFGLLTAVSMYLFFLLHEKNRWRNIIWLAIVNALLLYAHFFGSLVIGIQVVIVLTTGRFRSGGLKRYALSAFFTAVLYLPYFPVMLGRFRATSHSGTWVEKPVFSDLYTMVWRYSNAPVATVLLLALIAAGAGVYIYQAAMQKKLPSPYTRSVFIWFLFPYLGMFLVSFVLPVFFDRYTVFVSIGFYLLAGVMTDILCRTRWLSVALPVIAVAGMLATFNPNTDNKRRLREVVDKISSLKTINTVVIICPSWLEYGFAYHYSPSAFRHYSSMRKLLNGDNIFPVNDVGQIDQGRMARADNVIYFEEWATLVDPENRIFRMLDTAFTKTREYHIYESFKVSEFTRKK